MRASETPRNRRLHQIAKTAKRLSALLARQKDLLLGESHEVANVILETIIATAESHLAPPLTGPPVWASGLRQELGVNGSSAFQWLAGHRLADIYENHFEREARFSRDANGQPSGPYVRFVRQVLLEFGITNRGAPYSNEAIAHALAVRKRKGNQHD